MEACELATVGSHEGDFQRKAIDEIELSPHDNARCRLTALLDCKAAVVEPEHVKVLGKQRREDFLLVPFHGFGLIIAEHEDVAAGRVAMEVAVEKDVATFECALHHELRVVVDRVELA